MGNSDLVQKVGGTNTLLIPGSQKLGERFPPGPHGGCAYDGNRNGNDYPLCLRHSGREAAHVT
jgi:hypothetical protein